jgi:hypothetical protein
MHMQRLIGPSLAGIIALGFVGAAAAQTATPAASPQAASSSPFHPGTQSTATYPIPNGTLTVNAGMPARVKQFGPPPSFKSLDRDGNGRLSQQEAEVYPPLDNAFLYVSGGKPSISRAQYERWVQQPN